MKRGVRQVLRLGDQEVEYDPRFRLYLQTKLRWAALCWIAVAALLWRRCCVAAGRLLLGAGGCVAVQAGGRPLALSLPHPCDLPPPPRSNPHYKPEVAAQTALVNFCVTERGLEDQLLALVVDHERPELQESAQRLVRQLGDFTIQLRRLEDELLARLAASQGDILDGAGQGGWGRSGGRLGASGG